MAVTAIWMHGMGASFFDFGEPEAALLRARLPQLDIRLCDTREAFEAVLPEAELAFSWFFEQRWFELAPKLKWMITPAAGRDYANITPPEHVRQYNGSFHGKLMGETAVGMMLAASRGLLDTMRLQEQHPWPRQQLESRMRLLRGSHVVIWGFGHIGQWIGRYAKPFGVRLTGIRRTIPEAVPDYFTANDQIVTTHQADDVLPTADHLVLILPATGTTDNLITARRLAALPRHAWLYNLGRGNAVDESALVASLQAGELAGACLDVYQQEPLPEDSPLRSAPNTLLMPHASAFAPEYLQSFIEEFVERFPIEIAASLVG